MKLVHSARQVLKVMIVFHHVQGFYSVYREIFAKVAAEDIPYMDKEEEAMPAFGEAMYIQSLCG